MKESVLNPRKFRSDLLLLIGQIRLLTAFQPQNFAGFTFCLNGQGFNLIYKFEHLVGLKSHEIVAQVFFGNKL